jgi:hypothetical protein
MGTEGTVPERRHCPHWVDGVEGCCVCGLPGWKLDDPAKSQRRRAAEMFTCGALLDELGRPRITTRQRAAMDQERAWGREMLAGVVEAGRQLRVSGDDEWLGMAHVLSNLAAQLSLNARGEPNAIAGLLAICTEAAHQLLPPVESDAGRPV